MGSDDPDFNIVQRMIKAMLNFDKKKLTLRHMKVMMGVEATLRASKGKVFPTEQQIGEFISLAPADFSEQLNDLVELRYLHRMHPTFGDLIYTYKHGSLGALLMQQVFPAAAKQKAVEEEVG